MQAKIIDYIEEYIQKEKQKGISQTKALEKIGVPKTSMNQYRTGTIPNDEPLIKLSEALNIEPIELLTLANSERAKNKETKRIWLKAYKNEKEKRPIAQKIRISQEISFNNA